MYSVLLLALAGTTALEVKVSPADPTAVFKSDVGSLKFDPACRDYTLETVSANPACAQRVAAAETGPALATVIHTLALDPARADEAIRLLERTVALRNHASLHYFLGSFLSTAEVYRPDYAKAVRHLTIAAEKGNPAAADLLAQLLLAGKGTTPDVPRAIQLLEAAANSGFPSSGVVLGQLYLSGRLVPKDEVRGRAWLDAAAAAGVPKAAELAAMAAMDEKVHNFQLIPAPQPVQVKAVRYGTFDNPDIPPSFGFDPTFQAVHHSPYDDAVTLEMLERSAASLPTPYLYELARRLAARDPDRALRTYLVARVRMTYDASRCDDPAALEAVGAWDLIVAKDLRYLLRQGVFPAAIVDAALVEEGKLAADTIPWWVCRSGMPEMSAALAGKVGPLKLKQASEWPALREAARSEIASRQAS